MIRNKIFTIILIFLFISSGFLFSYGQKVNRTENLTEKTEHQRVEITPLLR